VEVTAGPILFGCAGFTFGLWIVFSDSRRMGFEKPHSPSPSFPGKKARRLIAGLAALAAAVLMITAPRVRPAILMAAAALAARVLVQNARRKRRVREIRREWPFLIESMAVAALSGLDTASAFQAAARRTRGILRAETDKVVLRLMSGASLSRALSVMDDSWIPEVKRLRSVLAQSEILGTPVAGMLKSLSDEGYEAERQAMEERFNALPLQLSAITVFFLLPPVLAVSVLPHILAFLESSW
jgi:pilus assembly protein TadC